MDIAGLVRDAHEGKGLGNDFLAAIRRVGAICHVLRRFTTTHHYAQPTRLFLSCFCLIAGCFEDEDIIHVEGSVDPIRDCSIVETELILSDLEFCERRRETLTARAKGKKKGDGFGGAPLTTEEAVVALDVLNNKVIPLLDEGIPSRWLRGELDSRDLTGLITAKPILYVRSHTIVVLTLSVLTNVDAQILAVDEDEANGGTNQWASRMREHLKVGRSSIRFELRIITLTPTIFIPSLSQTRHERERDEAAPLLSNPLNGSGAPICVELSPKLELQAAEYGALEAKTEGVLGKENNKAVYEYLAEYGLKRTGLDRVSGLVRPLLGQSYFYTVGEKESKAWSIPVNALAPRAAAVIHSDFEKHFIRAEVMRPEDYLRFDGQESKVRAAGLLRTEGKEYEVRVVFRLCSGRSPVVTR